MLKKVMIDGPAARKKILKGALEVGRMVGTTLGPGGRNALIISPYNAPTSTNDGVTIARNIALDDEVEDLGAQTMVEACMKTNERAGDGTTGTAVIAGALIEDCMTQIGIEEKAGALEDSGRVNVVEMAKSILDARDIVIEKVKKGARDLKKGDIKNIVATSIGKIYPGYVDTLADMVEKVGSNGYISVEDNWNTQYGVDAQVLEGMRFLGTYNTPYAVTNNRKEAIWENALVLVTNHRIENAGALKNIIEKIKAPDGAPGKQFLVIIAEGYSKDVNDAMAGAIILTRSGKKAMMQVLGVKAPSLTTEQFEDVAVFCDAKLIDKNTGATVETASFKDLGYAKKVVVDEDDTVITEGRGNVEQRLKVLNDHLKIEKDVSFANQIKRRIGALQSAFAIIRVGAPTDTEREYIKYKIEDAIYAAKAALEEGVVKGGGLALLEIAEELGTDNILYKALRAPHEKIKRNLGVTTLKVAPTVIDPLKVIRIQVENACSVAAQLITTEVAIANKRKSLWDELDKKMMPRDEMDDFRDAENQQAGFRT